MQAEWEELAALDERILSAARDFAAADMVLDRRTELVRILAAGADSIAALDELTARNRRLTEWLLHWRRVTLIESIALDQHLRFLRTTGGSPDGAAGLEVLG